MLVDFSMYLFFISLTLFALLGGLCAVALWFFASMWGGRHE